MRSSWIAACAIGLAVSAALLLGSVWGASSFIRAAQDRTIERVRRDLQTYFDDETVSTVAAKRFLEMLPSGGGDFKIVGRDRMRELVRALGEVDSSPNRVERSRARTASRMGRAPRYWGSWNGVRSRWSTSSVSPARPALCCSA